MNEDAKQAGEQMGRRVPSGGAERKPAREEVLALLHEYTQSESLRKHALAVEAAMRAYARKFGEDEEEWGLIGLIHDFDYERYPDLQDHPFRGAEILREKGYPESWVRAVLSHASHTGVARERPIEKALYAVDELTGFIVAATLVRPSRSLHDLKASSVKKKLKEKGFARSVNREEVYGGAEGLGVDLTEHITFVIEAMRPIAPELGLEGQTENRSR